MKRYLAQSFLVLAVLAFFSGVCWAHCEIPCGIYDDQARIDMILEHITTIEKSMKEIQIIEKEKSPNYNQLVRWVMNKEHHATEIQTIVSQYFMTQRLKAGAAHYDQKLATLQQMLVFSMKCKQTTDLKNAARLRELVKTFHGLYFHKH